MSSKPRQPNNDDLLRVFGQALKTQGMRAAAEGRMPTLEDLKVVGMTTAATLIQQSDDAGDNPRESSVDTEGEDAS